MFLRRLGQNEGKLCSTGYNCPQVLEMKDRSFAVAGQDITMEAIAALPPGPGIGPKERVVKIPRDIMLAAISDILAAG